MSATATDTLLTLQQAVEHGYGGYSTLRKYIAEGRLPASKVGARIKVRRSDLDALLVRTSDLSFEVIEAEVERLAAKAPPLTDDQCRRLAAVFGGEAKSA